MNHMSRQACAALLSGVLLTAGAQAAVITTSTDQITLGENSNTFTLELRLEEDKPFAGAEFGIDLPEKTTLTQVDYLDQAIREASHTPEVVRDGRVYFGFYGASNAFQGEYSVARLTFTYTGSEDALLSLGTSNVVTLNEDGTTTGDTSSAPFQVKIEREESSGGSSGSGGSGGSERPEEDIDEGETPLNPGVFTDLEGHWGKDAALRAVEMGLFSGTSATTFSPDMALSRAMLVTVLHRQEGTPAAAQAAFQDVSAGSWYESAVNWAAAENIVSGVGEGCFAPDQAITREQLAVMLYRYEQYRGNAPASTGDLSAFVDRDQISPWAEEAMKWALGAGILSGKDVARLDPQGSATRAEAASILVRLLDR